MKKKPILKQKNLNTISSKENQEKKVFKSFRKLIIGVYNNPYFVSELGSFISENTTLDVLIIDSDSLNPLVSETLGMKNTYNTNISSDYVNTTSSFNMVMDYILREKPSQEVFKSLCVKHKSLHVLTGNDDLNAFEYYPNIAFPKLLNMAINCFDICIVNTNSSIFDLFFVNTIDICDMMIYPIEAYYDNLLIINKYIKYIQDNKGLEMRKSKVVAFNYLPSLHVSVSELKTATESNFHENNFLHTIRYDKKRQEARNSFSKQYQMSKGVKEDYTKLISKFNIDIQEKGLGRLIKRMVK